MRHLFCLLSIAVLRAQVVDYIRPQPVIQHSDILSKCCTASSDSELLLECANKSIRGSYSSSVADSKIALVSYSTPGIFDYTAYSLSVNGLFAELNGYGMVLLTPDDGAMYEPRDQRWNKVKILLDALDPVGGWGRDLEYIVWLDSDLIFLDMGMKIEHIVAEYDSFDMIFSADPEIENGVVNSGFFIVKNTEWSRQFLKNWWDTYDRILGMDQHIFTRLWEDGLPAIANRIAILRPDAINTNFPSWKNQQSYNQVLHLAGVSGLMRRLAFKHGFDVLCSSFHETSVTVDGMRNLQEIPHQIGLDRLFLEKLEQDLPRGELVRQVIQEMRSRTGKNISVAEVRKLSSKLDDVLQMGFRKEGEKIDGVNVADIILEGLLWTYGTLKNVTSFMTSRSSRLEGIQATLESMYAALMRLEHDPALSLQLLSEGGVLIDEMLSIIHSRSRGPALYYKFKHREFLALRENEVNNMPAALAYYKEAMEVWWEMHNLKSYGSGNGAIDPYFEGSEVLAHIAGISCMLGDYAEGLEASRHIIHFYEEVWERGSRETPRAVRKNHGRRLAVYANCAVEAGDMAIAIEGVEKGIAILEGVGEESNVLNHLYSLRDGINRSSEQPESIRPKSDADMISSSADTLPGRSSRMLRRKMKRRST